ncbi:MAG: ATP phosphoribosyltransferase [Pseudomonadota bacterium]
MTDLILAIPSKGRLKEQSEAFFQSSGFKLSQKGGDRGYEARLDGLENVQVLLLSAREIAQGLIDGAFHVGITGEDLLHDLSERPGEDARVIKPLGFGFADAVVAVPNAWLDVSKMADLEAAAALFRERHGRRMKVATKYMRLTRRFFAANSVGEYRLVYSGGATEAAPASGAADLIVDITTSGATLKANGLKVIDDGVILKSQACLTGSLFADWTDQAQAALRGLLGPVEARSAAVDLTLLGPAKPLPAKLVDTLGLSQYGPASVTCPSARATEIAQMLTEQGYGPVSVQQPDFIFTEHLTLFEKFFSKV